MVEKDLEMQEYELSNIRLEQVLSTKRVYLEEELRKTTQLQQEKDAKDQ